MRKLLVQTLGVTLILMTSVAAAHEPMQHVCVAPERPLNESDDVLWQGFVSEIDAFRDCVNDKMEWHQEAANIHEENARQVVNVWNDFVQTSLNAPEDFPWPPE